MTTTSVLRPAIPPVVVSVGLKYVWIALQLAAASGEGMVLVGRISSKEKCTLVIVDCSVAM